MSKQGGVKRTAEALEAPLREDIREELATRKFESKIRKMEETKRTPQNHNVVRHTGMQHGSKLQPQPQRDDRRALQPQPQPSYRTQQNHTPTQGGSRKILNDVVGKWEQRAEQEHRGRQYVFERDEDLDDDDDDDDDEEEEEDDGDSVDGEFGRKRRGESVTPPPNDLCYIYKSECRMIDNRDTPSVAKIVKQNGHVLSNKPIPFGELIETISHVVNQKYGDTLSLDSVNLAKLKVVSQHIECLEEEEDEDIDNTQGGELQEVPIEIQ